MWENFHLAKNPLSGQWPLAQLLPMRSLSEIPSWAEVYRTEVAGAIRVQ
jgi:hypothetical protein